ncbi:uncharacterized protein UTRI_10028 [Ustilago trichophora]|uniref:Uncharacterized protein n=1 Tax=Ustilago trichophora TaxID=86804 RepID=A0A5C3DSQ1_9BASI|nr:uncharacterized protein UTRI_10028 [Ustilago trichophora]
MKLPIFFFFASAVAALFSPVDRRPYDYASLCGLAPTAPEGTFRVCIDLKGGLHGNSGQGQVIYNPENATRKHTSVSSVLDNISNWMKI